MTAETEPHMASGPSGAFGRLAAALDWWTCAACVVLFAAILFIMILQVTFRYVLNTPLTWTEELARYIFIWACYLGAPVATRRGNHVTITFVAERLHRGVSRVVTLGIQAISLVFFLQLAIFGAILVVKSHSVEAITLPIPWSLIYLAVPISGLLMILQTVDGGRALRQGGGEEARA